MKFLPKSQQPDLDLSLWEKLKLFRIARNPAMLAKLKSRKLWVTVVTAAVTVLGEQLGIDPEVTTKLIGLAAAYLLGQGYADGQAARAKSLSDSGPVRLSSK